MKNSSDTSGFEPATFRFVAQHLNHCANAVPTHFTIPALITTDPEDEPSVLKHVHVEDTVKIKIKFSLKRCILLVYIIRLYYDAQCKKHNIKTFIYLDPHVL